jgi:ribosomal protein S18 acetylase RimI-like enzyme
MRLIEENTRIHIHLDWTTVDDWIEDPGTVIGMAWDGTTLAGVMAFSPMLAGASWLRLAAVHDDSDPDAVFAAIWPGLFTRLIAQRTKTVTSLMIRTWLTEPLTRIGFRPLEHVVTLARNGGPIPEPLRQDLALWHGDLQDLNAVISVDHAAFPPMWQMPADSLRQAIRGANSFTLAMHNAQIVGYQITMRYTDGGHLARLATVPQAQSTGVGGALLGHMLADLMRRGVYYVTVNTQETNRRSLSLYQRFGFTLTGLDYPVYSLPITGA